MPNTRPYPGLRKLFQEILGMPDTELFHYTVKVTGRLRAHDRADAEEKLKAGLCLSLPFHDSVDDLTIAIEPEEGFEDMKRRFS